MEDVKQSLRPGDIFAGKYRVDRILGEGGMGVVIGATHQLTQDRVALKFLLPQAAEIPEVRQRFLNEARAAVQIKSEHVARITDVDATKTGLPYMVMEFLEGRDLGDLVGKQGALPLQTAVDYLLQACEALAEAHALGIVHRDLKPANLFLTHRKDGSPLVKVLDFGISKLNTTPGEQRLTHTRGAMGSPLYMSPEQMTNPKAVDARSDIWSLGVVLYELLTGLWPFEADTVEGLVIEIVTQQAKPLRSRRPELPTQLEKVVARCLEKKPEKRFSSVAELAEALATFGSAQATASAVRISRVLSAPRNEAAPQKTIDPVGAPGERSAQQLTGASWTHTQKRQTEPVNLPIKRSPLPLLGAALALFAVVGLFAATRSAKESPAPAAPVPAAATSQGVASASAAAVTPPPVESASASATPVASTPPEAPRKKQPPPPPGPKAPPAVKAGNIYGNQ